MGSISRVLFRVEFGSLKIWNLANFFKGSIFLVVYGSPIQYYSNNKTPTRNNLLCKYNYLENNPVAVLMEVVDGGLFQTRYYWTGPTDRGNYNFTSPSNNDKNWDSNFEFWDCCKIMYIYFHNNIHVLKFIIIEIQKIRIFAIYIFFMNTPYQNKVILNLLLFSQ